VFSLNPTGGGVFVASVVARAFLLAACIAMPVSTWAQEAQWIWSPEHPRGQAPEGDCYFRRAIQLDAVEEATITITADDAYDLFINGRQIGSGRSIRQMEQYDVSRLMQRGTNVIAVRVANLSQGPAALAARVFIKQRNKEWLSYSTDQSWRTHLDRVENWTTARINDSRWKPAQVFGLLGETAPWDRREDVTASQLSENQRFRINQEFVVNEILGSDSVGSLINMAFNEFGHIIASQEGGPLLLIYDSDKDGVPDKTREYCDLVQNIQGILPLNGDVFVTGDGPDGSGVYRLTDEDHNGKIDNAEKIVGFKGSAGEHGAHGLAFGIDGNIYCVAGNHVQYDGEFAASSPLKHYYEGDLVQPRMEDPGGHAHGIKAPGGTVIRFSTEGDRVELVAGGLRNAFDLVQHPNGRMFTHDSDMESDEGAVWYRPTSLYEIAEAGEYGWRSGWAKWPSYYFDRLPPTLETGRGSPTGGCVYSHFTFPKRYHDCLFLADWSQGQILSVKLDDKGNANSEVFIQGQPLNVTDVTVGPDGCLYFCTGGRGTKGGIYQVRWLGKVPKSVMDLGSGIARAIKQPQMDSAWGRQAVAALKRELGASWSTQITQIARGNETPPQQRVRALELMQLFGPMPSTLLLTELTEANSELVRAKAAYLLGLQEINPIAGEKLTRLLGDSEPKVQLAAGEALLRAGYEAAPNDLTPLLASSDRKIAWTARKLLERNPAEGLIDLLQHENQRVRLQAGLALMVVAPTPENSRKVLTGISKMLSGFVSDRNLADLLRLTQVALHRGGLKAADLPDLTKALVSEFPVGQPALNRELFRILTYLNAEEVLPAAIASLQQDLPFEDRMHIALHLSLFKHQWAAAERYQIVKFFEETQKVDSGSSVPLYVMNLTKRLCKDLTLEEARIFVSEGAQWPNAALVSLYRFPEKLSEADLATLKKLDQEIDRKGYEAEQFKRLRTGIVAMLSQHGDAQSQAYLREIWIRSPERRQAVAMGLAQYPTDENWDYLVRSLPVLESYAVGEVMTALQKILAATDDSQALREVILQGLRMEKEGQSPQPALDLLAYWIGSDFSQPAHGASDSQPGDSQPGDSIPGDSIPGDSIPGDSIPGDSKMQGWQAWFAENYPDQPPAQLPQLEQSSNWSINTLTEYFLSSDGRKGSSEAGKVAYEKAKCADCHRYGTEGQSIGPDLTTVASRFTRKEVLESILFPSHIISDQYRSQQVLTTDGKVVVGLVTKNSAGEVVVKDSQLQEHTIAEENIESMEVSKISMMPTGLIDTLSAAEIRDLMTYLGYVPEQQPQQQSPQTADLQEAVTR